MTGTWLDVVSVVVQFLTFVGIALAALQLFFQGRQIHRDFETLYVRRYWELMDMRSKQWVLKGKLKPGDEKVVRGYLQLCEDEIDLRRLGRVTDSTWHFWDLAIREQLSEDPYLAMLGARQDDYPRLQEFWRQRDSPRTRDRDQLPHSWLWRRTHGL